MPTERRPNLFIVGAQKSGTSALAGWLSQHPQTFMSFPKEPGYLAFGETGYTFPDGYGKTAPASQYVVTSADRYNALFSSATQNHTVIAEASTWYFALPGMAKKLKQYNSAAKILVVLRNPVDRAYSAWSHARGSDLEPCADFSDAWRLAAKRTDSEFLLRYRQMGMYSDALEEFRQEFPDAQMRVLWYDDLRKDPVKFWQQVCEFLDIDASHEPPFEHRYNPSGSPRFKWLRNALASYTFRRILKPIVPYKLALRIKARLDAANLKKFPAMSEDMRQLLKAHYRDDILRVQSITGRDLEGWLT